MAASTCDKLQLLARTSEGLLNRLYYVRESIKECKCLKDRTFKGGIYYALESKFPSLDISEDRKYEQFKAQSSGILNELETPYRTFLGIVDFCLEADDFLNKFFQNVSIFNYQLNRNMVGWAFDILCNYVRMHIFLARFTEVKLISAIFAAAFTATHPGEREVEFEGLAQFLDSIGSGEDEVLERLRVKFSDGAPVIVGGLELLLPTYTSMENFDKLQKQNTFELLVFSSQSAFKVSPANDAVYEDILDLGKFPAWILTILLIMPDQLQNSDRIKQLLKVALEDGFRLRVFRTEFILVHPQLQKMIAVAKRDKKLLKAGLKKLVNNSEFVAVESSVFKHRNRRIYLTNSLRQMLTTLEECPGLVAPKMPAVLAGLAATQSEIEWFLRHQGAAPEKKGFFSMSKTPNFAASEWLDTRKPKLTDDEAQSAAKFHTVTELVHLNVRLQQFCRNNKRLVSAYFLKYLGGADLDAVKSAIEDGVLKHFPRVKTHMDEIRQILGRVDVDRCESAEVHEGMVKIRRNWLAIAGAVAGTNVSRDTQDALNRLIVRMRMLYRHTQYVDQMETLLVNHASLRIMWWHMDAAADMFTFCISKRMAQGNYARYAVSIIRWLQQALDNVCSFCPEEQASIGAPIAKTADEWLKMICDSIVGALGKLLEAHAKLDSTPAAVHAAVGAVASNWGTESYPTELGTRQTMLLYVAEKHLSMLAGAIAEIPAFDVYNRRFIPQAYLRDRLSQAMERMLSGMCSEKNRQRDTGLMRPYLMLEELNRFHNLLETIAHRTLIGAHKIVYESVSKQVACDAVVADGPLDTDIASSKKPDMKTFIGQACSIFWNFLSSIVTADVNTVCANNMTGYAYSPVTHSFVQWTILGDGRRQRNYHECRVSTTPVLTGCELESFCCMAGRNGVRVLESYLLGNVRTLLTHMYKVIQLNKGHIGAFQRALQSPNPQFLPILAQFKHLDEFLHASIKIGNVLYFRDMLRRANGVVLGKRAPLVHSWLYRAAKSVRPANSRNADLETVGLGGLSRMLGTHSETLKAGHLDSDMVEIMESLAQTDSQHLWELLPYMYSASFLSNVWRGGFYLPHIQACGNGAHSVSIVIQKLLTSVAANQCKSKVSGKKLQSSLVESLRLYVQSSIRVLLEMRKKQRSTMPKAFPVPLSKVALRSCFVFVELVVDACGARIPHSLIEETMPHSLAQSCQVDIVLGVQTADDALRLGSLMKVLHERDAGSPASAESPASPAK